MKNKGVEFKINVRKTMTSNNVIDPLASPKTPAMVIRFKYKGKEWGYVSALSEEPDAYTAEVIERALNQIGESFTYRGGENVLDKIIQKVHRVGMVLRYKLQGSVSASASDCELEAEEVERD